MIGTISVKIAAHNPSFPLEPVFTFVNSAQSFRIMNVPRKIGQWDITKVFVNLLYPDNTTITKECVLNGNIWVGTVEGCATSGTSTNGFYVTASGIDENENVITNYVLGAGDLYVKDLDGTIDPERVGTKMYFNDTIPTNPKKGDATFIQGTLNVWDGLHWVPVAVTPDPSFIIDADGNKIYADRTVEVVEQGEQSWTLTDGTNTYTLTGTRLNSMWETESERYTLVGQEDEGNNAGAWTLKYETPLPGMPIWVTQWTEFYNGTFGEQSLTFPTHGFTATWDDGRTLTEDELALKSDLPTKTSDLTNDSGFITSADVPTKTSDLTNDSGFITTDEVLPFHNPTTPTVNTGLANKAYRLSLNDPANSGQPLADGTFAAIHRNTRDLTDVFAAGFDFNTYWPYELTQFNGQTYDPSLELKFCHDKLTFLRQGRPRQVYSGWMFRTSGAGFAIPCSEDATPAGTLYETTGVQANYVLVSSETPHTIGFTSYGDDQYNHIVSLDGQEGMIAASRAGNIKTKSINETLANKSELPTKTSDLTNDSGFITATALTPYREKSDLYYEHSFHKANWQNVPRFIMNYNGTQTIFDKFDSTLDRWTVSTGTSDWYVQTTFVGMEADPQFTLIKLEIEISNILPTEGAGTTTVSFIDMGIEGTFTMDMSDQLVCKVYVDRQISALEARIAALENNNQ